MSTSRRSVLLISLASIAIALARLNAHDLITTRVTWNSDVSRLVQARCVGCHAPGGKGPMPLTTYEEARPWARAIREEVLTRRMPKWHAVRGYGDFTNDPSLSPFEIATIVAWADGGAPKGPDTPAVGTNASPASRNENDGKPVDRTVRTLTLPCGDQPLPVGRIVGIEPRLDPKGSVGIAVRQPDGSREIVAWIRGFEPDFRATYWLRNPIVTRRGTRLIATADSRCSVVLSIRSSR